MKAKHEEAEFYSVDQVAERLGLHVRTVRNYVRSGKLKAVRIGKQYRIARGALEALTGGRGDSRPLRAAARRVDVSSIVDIEPLDTEAAGRITTGLMATAKGRDGADEPLRIDTIYDTDRARLRIIVTGDLLTSASLLRFISVYVTS